MFSACLGTWLLLRLRSYLYPNLLEGADHVGGQLCGDEECPFSGVTKSGRVWRKMPESDATHPVPPSLALSLMLSPSPPLPSPLSLSICIHLHSTATHRHSFLQILLERMTDLYKLQDVVKCRAPSSRFRQECSSWTEQVSWNQG